MEKENIFGSKVFQGPYVACVLCVKGGSGLVLYHCCKNLETIISNSLNCILDISSKVPKAKSRHKLLNCWQYQYRSRKC